LFVRDTDRPMVLNMVHSRDRSTDGSLRYDTWFIVKPIDRWSYAVHPWGRSTGGYVSYTSPPSLVRWTWGLGMADRL